MTFTQARKRLEKLGFGEWIGTWGCKAPESYDCKSDHFVPRNRDVFFAKCNDGYYVTSHIRGKLRRYRCKTWYNDVDKANIFGGGKTLREAIEVFEKNFLSKTYNIRGT